MPHSATFDFVCQESSEREEIGVAGHGGHSARGGDGTYLSRYPRDGADVVDITDFGSAQGPTRFGVVSCAGAPRAGRKVALKPTRPIRPEVYKPRCSLYTPGPEDNDRWRNVPHAASHLPDSMLMPMWRYYTVTRFYFIHDLHTPRVHVIAQPRAILCECVSAVLGVHQLPETHDKKRNILLEALERAVELVLVPRPEAALVRVLPEGGVAPPGGERADAGRVVRDPERVRLPERSAVARARLPPVRGRVDDRVHARRLVVRGREVLDPRDHRRVAQPVALVAARVVCGRKAGRREKQQNEEDLLCQCPTS